MIAESLAVEKIVQEAIQLTPKERVRLIQLLAETMLVPTEKYRGKQKYLVYGEFGGGRMSTEEDFKIAEWHPTDEELDGP